MALRKLFTRRPPTQPAAETTSTSLVEQALAMPQLVPVRLFWDNLQAVRPWWPVLIPLMLWVGVRAYQRERAAVQSRAE